MCDSCVEQYIRNAILEIRHRVMVWWFPKDFSQSRLVKKPSGSNACTIIALLVAQKCHNEGLLLLKLDEYSETFWQISNILAESIIEGNEIYDLHYKLGNFHHVNLTIPEALKAAAPKLKTIKEWKSFVHTTQLDLTLHKELEKIFMTWNKSPPKMCSLDLYVLLIAGSRTILMIYQKHVGMVTLIDSHQHNPNGAVIAQTTIDYLRHLCAWYCNTLIELYDLRPDCYELSFNYIKC